MAKTPKQVKVSIWRQLPVSILMILLWMLLWGSYTPLTIVTGIIVVFVVSRVFYLTPLDVSDRFSPFWFVVTTASLTWQMIVGSVKVGWFVLMPKGRLRNSVVAIHLHTRNDLIMTWTAIAISVIPGSLVLEVDRERFILYMHVMGTDTAADADAVRASVARTESMIVRAVGTKENLASLRAEDTRHFDPTAVNPVPSDGARKELF